MQSNAVGGVWWVFLTLSSLLSVRARADFLIEGCPAFIERQLIARCGQPPYQHEARILVQLKDILRSEGYYQPQFERSGEDKAGGYVCKVKLGPPLLVGDIKLGTPQGELPDILKQFYQENLLPARGERLSHQRYESLKKSLISYLKSEGYRQARWIQTRLEINVEAQVCHWIWSLDCGPLFSVVRVEYQTRTGSRFPIDWLEELEPFQKGDSFSDAQYLRFYETLMGTGWFQSLWIYAEPPESDGSGSVIQCVALPSKKLKWDFGLSILPTEKKGLFKAEFKAPWVNAWGHQLHGLFTLDVSNFLSWPQYEEFFFEYKIPRVYSFRKPLSIENALFLRKRSRSIYPSNPRGLLKTYTFYEHHKSFQITASGYAYRFSSSPLRWKIGAAYERPSCQVLSEVELQEEVSPLHYLVARFSSQCPYKGALSQMGGGLGFCFDPKVQLVGFFAKSRLIFEIPPIRWQKLSFSWRWIGKKIWSWPLKAEALGFPSSKYLCTSGGEHELTGYEEGAAAPIKFIRPDYKSYGAQNLWGTGIKLGFQLKRSWQIWAFGEGVFFDGQFLKKRWESYLLSVGIAMSFDHLFIKTTAYFFYHIPEHNFWLRPSLGYLPGFYLKIGK